MTPREQEIKGGRIPAGRTQGATSVPLTLQSKKLHVQRSASVLIHRLKHNLASDMIGPRSLYSLFFLPAVGCAFFFACCWMCFFFSLTQFAQLIHDLVVGLNRHVAGQEAIIVRDLDVARVVGSRGKRHGTLHECTFCTGSLDPTIGDPVGRA